MGDKSDVNVKLQDPDDDIKPRLSTHQVPELVRRLYGLETSEVKSLPSYDDLNFYVRVNLKVNDNPNINSIYEHGYVVKVLNSLQSASPEIIDAQHALCQHVHDRGISTQRPVLNVQGHQYSLETFACPENGHKLGPYLVRLVTFVPGTIFYETPYVAGSFYNAGVFVARLHNAILDGFHHPFYDGYNTLWSLTETPRIREFCKAVADTRDRDVVLKVLDEFQKDIVDHYPDFTPGIVHGDINEQNLIMREVPGQDSVPPEQRIHDVAALLDFSDITKSYIVFDVAISICYLSIECGGGEQLNVGGHFLSGYTKHRTLNEVEWRCLPLLVCARLCQSLVYGAHAYSLQPENKYLLTTSYRGWPLLHKYWSENKEELVNRWKRLCEQ